MDAATCMDMELKKHEMSLRIFDLERQLAEATRWHDGPEIPPMECVIAEFEMDGETWHEVVWSEDGKMFVGVSPKLIRWTRSCLSLQLPQVKEDGK